MKLRIELLILYSLFYLTSASFSQTPTSVVQTVDKLKQEGTQQFYSNLQNSIQSSLSRTEVSITAQQFNKPLFSILTT